MLLDIANSTVVAWSVFAGGSALALFAGWNCLIDMWSWKWPRRSDAENQRLAEQAASAVMDSYGPRNGSAKRAFWEKRIAHVVYQTFSGDGSKALAKRPRADRSKPMGSAMPVRRPAAVPPSAL